MNAKITPKTAFKFLHADDVEKVLTCRSLKFGRLAYYRLLENVYDDQWIGDAQDGVTRSVVSFEIHDQPIDHPDRDLARQAGFNIAPGSRVVVRGMNIAKFVDGFVLSLSVGNLEPLSAAMCRAADRPNYNACIEIGVAELIEAVKNSTFEGRPISETFTVEHDFIIYLDDSPGDGRTIAPADPFRKRSIYRSQSEYRIFLLPREAVPKIDAIYLTLPPDIKVPMRRVAVACSSNEKKEPMSRQEAIGILRRFHPVELDESALPDVAKAYMAVRPPNGVNELDEAFGLQMPAYSIANRVFFNLLPKLEAENEPHSKSPPFVT